jgi:Tol biopolymer transport system component
VFVGSSLLMNGSSKYYNTDIYVSRLDGTDLRQLTHHAADDLSPAWSNDGKYIYFVSQRGDADGVANVWRMKFSEY